MKRFSNILLSVESDTDHSAALQRAIALAKNNQAALTICTVVDAIPPEMAMSITMITPGELRDIAVAEERDRLEAMVSSIASDDATIGTKVLVGRAPIEIIRQVISKGHDLVIKSADTTSRSHNRLFGSTDMKLMRKCPCPVWIVKGTERQQYRRILAAVDQDPEGSVDDALNRQILEMSTSLALAEFSELHIVHAWSLFGERYLRSPHTDTTDAALDAMLSEESDKRQRWLEKLVKSYGTGGDKDAVDYVSPKLYVVKGDAQHIVPTTARELDVDLIVMGTVARTGIAGLFMGNTAETILNHIDCSVLTVKPPEFVSPVIL
jgi:nucleotide-binding universal stress UspA family protein